MPSEDTASSSKRGGGGKRDGGGRLPHRQFSGRGGRGGRGGRAGDRSRGDRNSSYRGRFNRTNHNNNNNNNSNKHFSGSNNRTRSGNDERRGRETHRYENKNENLTDEDILIAFAPLLRSGNSDAIRIHEQFALDSNNASFMAAARKLVSLKHNNCMKPTDKDPSQLTNDDPILNTPDRNEMEMPATSINKSSTNSKGITNPNIGRQLEDKIDEQPHSHGNQINNPPTSQTTSNNPCSFSKLTPVEQKIVQPQTSAAIQTRFEHMNVQPTPNIIYNTPSKTPPGLSPQPTEAPNVTSNTLKKKSIKNETEYHDENKQKNSKTNETKEIANEEPPKPNAPKNVHQPKRLFRNQPGTLHANDQPSSKTLTLRPRSQLTARWSIPITYLRDRTIEQSKKAAQKNPNTLPINPNITIRDALQSLCVGLFRLGCPENGQHFTIVAKNVLVSGNFNIQGETIWGEVPFYAPRSPGSVILRMYFQDDTVPTIATGPIINVEVRTGTEVDATLRFLLSNFKSKKGANISTMHSLAAVFSTFSPSQHQNQRDNGYEGAGRAAWGCVCESKKALEIASQDFYKKKEKLTPQEEELLQWKEEQKLKDIEDNSNLLEINVQNHDNTDGNEEQQLEQGKDDEQKEAMTIDKWKEKMGSLMGEKASIERKWRDAQIAYSSILKEALSNNYSWMLLRRDLLTKLRLEFELWCPICEAFAPNPFEKKHPTKSTDESSQAPVFNIYPYPISAQHFRLCSQSRNELRMKTLGFLPRTETLQQLLSHKGSSVMGGVVGQANHSASGNKVLQRLTVVMHKMYKEKLCPSKDFYETRALVRKHIETIVNTSNAFPPGTKVVLFGSSANGFGSPNSDLDMCIELPPGSVPGSLECNGSTAMSILAETLSENGMKEVNTSRLSARIPIIMFEYPYKVDTETILMLQCDISMQNPLACLNTQLLKAYSGLDSRVCILASIIKRWAKRRNINNPSHHTLSSYGYIIMLLHFLTRTEGLPATQPTPVLPNLQWIDPVALSNNQFRHAKPSHPKFFLRHPTEPDFFVNSYFLNPNDSRLNQVFSSNNQSVGYLLTSFFRYYAYDFNYKKHVVSLNSTPLTGMIEKEVKGESDGWRLGAAASLLAIEDPFETFYDVAHVLKYSSFQRVRREFVRAYSKMVEAVWNGEAGDKNNGEVLLDWICEDVSLVS